MKIPWYYVDSALSLVLIVVLVLHYFHLDSIGADFDLLILFSILGTLPVFWRAYRAVREAEWASMDMLASVALAFSLIDQQWASAVFIALMLAAARILSEVTSARTEQSIRGLLKLRPNRAKVEEGGKIVVIPAAHIKVGDTVVVDLGERIPIDGIVLSGAGAVDESSLTGESLPVEKAAGAKVYSATLLTSGSIKIKVEKVGKDTTLEKIIALVESSRAEKPTTETLGARFGKLYLISIFALSAVLLAVTRDIPFILAVVLVVCADDVAVAIPIAYLRAIGAAAHRGVIIKGALHLETLGKATALVFDKTGTLTRGRLAVSSVVPAKGVSPREILEVVASVTERSTHPLSRALAAYAKAQGTAARTLTVEEIPGKGIIAREEGIMTGRRTFLEEHKVAIPRELAEQAEALSDQGQSVSFIAKAGRALGFAAVRDELKPGAQAVMRELKSLGVKHLVMLTGDNERVAAAVGKEVGIDDFHASLLPEDKVRIIEELSRKEVVVMVGDGVNDAAALSAAHVGVAMGAMGSDAAIESAEIALMRDDLFAIPETMRLARTVQRISVEDFWIWGATNAAGLAIVFAGLIGPAGAAAYNFISDFFPLINSMRVRLIAQHKRTLRERARRKIQ